MTRAILLVLPLVLTGCALDTTETADWDELSRMTNKRSLERLVTEFETVPETREEVAKGLIRRGRAFYSEHPKSKYKNLVIAMLGDTGAGSHIDCSIRAKAVWAIAEAAVLADAQLVPHARHEAKLQLARAHAGDSTAVADEVALSLNKLGFGIPEGEDAQGPELKWDGYETVVSYDPDDRGHIEKEIE